MNDTMSAAWLRHFCCADAREAPYIRRAVARTSRMGAGGEVRPAESADLSRVVALLAEANLPTAGLEVVFPGGYVVAEDRATGQLLAVAGLEVRGAFGLIRSLAVQSDARGRGLGAALLRERIEAARHRGLGALFGLTTTAADYLTRQGFRVITRCEVPEAVLASEEFSRICPASATVVRYDLVATDGFSRLKAGDEVICMS